MTKLGEGEYLDRKEQVSINVWATVIVLGWVVALLCIYWSQH